MVRRSNVQCLAHTNYNKHQEKYNNFFLLQTPFNFIYKQNYLISHILKCLFSKFNDIDSI